MCYQGKPGLGRFNMPQKEILAHSQVCVLPLIIVVIGSLVDCIIVKWRCRVIC